MYDNTATHLQNLGSDVCAHILDWLIVYYFIILLIEVVYFLTAEFSTWQIFQIGAYYLPYITTSMMHLFYDSNILLLLSTCSITTYLSVS